MKTTPYADSQEDVSLCMDLPELHTTEAVSIRDSLHKSIELSAAEMAMLREGAYQRLRGIKQIGFAEIPYPGATHTRYIHSIGAASLATRMWRNLQRTLRLPPADFAQKLRILRAAAMLHDIGHAPLSHTTESIMPPLAALALPAWLTAHDPARQAHHEDYSLKIILSSPIAQHLEAMGIPAEAVAQLISGIRLPDASPFQHEGIDLFPLMRQIISSEIDADRMDYLLRDALYAGVAYGQFDLDWLLRHLTPVFQDGRAYLGLRSRALFTFEDFLLSRYHMFFSVYYHHASICYQEMLQRFFAAEAQAYPLSPHLEAYLQTDDAGLLYALRQSKDPWAKRITQHQPYLRLFEVLLPDPSATQADSESIQLSSTFPAQDPQRLLDTLEAALQEAGIPFFRATSQWVISRYFRQPSQHEPPIYVVDDSLQSAMPIQQYSLLYRRYGLAQSLIRLYCDPLFLHPAQALLHKIASSSP